MTFITRLAIYYYLVVDYRETENDELLQKNKGNCHLSELVREAVRGSVPN